MEPNDKSQETVQSRQPEKGTMFSEPLGKDNVLSQGAIIAERYRVLSFIGEGGMGAVYKVEQIFLKTQYALKMLNAVALPDMAVRRFQQEARAASRLDHPNLVKAHEFGVLNGNQPYYVMDLVEGQTVSRHLKKLGTLSIDETLRLFIPVCFALAYAHQQGIIHRDIKPGNIMLATNPTTTGSYTAKVVDFGIAKMDEGATADALTRTGDVFGTPLYMSPEQCLGTKVDLRTDVYSLACVMYEALTGAPPFHGDSSLSIMMQHQSEMPKSLKEASMGREFPDLLEKIMVRCLEKNPDDRYQSMLDLANDLILLQQGVNVAKKADPVVSRRKRAYSRKQIAFLALGGLACMALGSLSTLICLKIAMPSPTVPPSDLKATRTAAPVAEAAAQDKSLGPFPMYEWPLSADEYFSTIEGKGQAARRVFKFPRKISLGTIVWKARKEDKLERIQAMGEVRLPVKGRLVLEVPWIILRDHADWLKHFRPEEVQGLRLLDNDPRRAFVGDDIFDKGLAYAAHLNRIERLDLDYSGASDKGLEFIKDFRHLNNLVVSKTNVTGDAIVALKSFPILGELHIEEVRGAHKVLSRLNEIKQLQVLNVTSCDLTDQDLKQIARCRTLKSLFISNNPRMTMQGLSSIGQMTNLTWLVCSRISYPPRDIIKAFGGMKQLHRLQVNGDNWSGSDIQNLRRQLPRTAIIIVRTKPGSHTNPEYYFDPPSCEEDDLEI